MNELDRIRAEYAQHQANPQIQARRSYLQPDVQFAIQASECAVMKMLAPPISRRLARWSRLRCEVLERFPLLCTHDLILIWKGEGRRD
jgi:hypothetical protein